MLDRNGAISKELSDVRVRQAINYALDRKTLTKALYGDYGTPTDQTVIKGQDGWVDKTLYPYDPAKAKKLLAQAGYPDGFSLDAVATNAHSRNIYTQAIAGELEKVGIKLNVVTENPDTSYYHDLWGGKYASAAMYLGAGSMFFEGQFLFLPTAQFNPFKSTDAKLMSLYQQAAAAPDAERKKLDQQMEERLMDIAWVAPISFIDSVMYSRQQIDGVDLTAGNGTSNPTWWKPAA
jgi:peptide/nickel transport system substrate-binding protein